jgi:cell division protein FtsI/penicillin-binding protein 2
MSKKNKGRHLSLRLNILFLITFLLFSALIFRLGFIQIVHGEDFRKETERNTVRKVSVEAPRGWMMDRNGEILVNNVPVYTVTYTESKGIHQDKEAIAASLANYIDMDSENILAEMNRGIAFAPQRIKQKLTFEEVSRVSEHLNELPGIDIMVDSIRDYKYDNLFRGFIGSVRDIPRDKLNYYLSRGYRMNEKVGVAFLEEQYEEQLRGTEGAIEVFVEAKTLKPISEPTLTPGQRGNDLLLTIDRNLQQAIETSISKSKEENELVKTAYFIAMDPQTGEILGMSNDVRTIGAGKTSYAAGSTVKMATVLMGLHEGIVTPQTVIQDAPITLPGGLVKRSWKNLGRVDALDALKKSSNIYMFNIGLKLANNSGEGDRYYRKEAFDDAFYYFSQFGLGVKTGIDLPSGLTGEYEGYQSNDRRLGLLADFMIGQYHNYTPLQLAQYVSTVANGGYRMQPYLVKEIRRGVPTEEELGQVVMKREPNVLNRIDMSDEHIKLVQQGMKMVTEPGGTAASLFKDFPVKVAAKTGTAQTVNPDGSIGLNNTIFVGYAPADNPQIAFACIVPESQSSNSQVQIAHAQVISKEVLEVFFNLNQDKETDEETEEDVAEMEADVE